jgi:Arc/MetJ-type ribon-helix-helix transcriptional regulator
MVVGMATTKVTITLEDDQLEEIRKLVSAEQVSNVSAFVKHAVRIALHDAAGWKEMLAEALQATGGPLTKKERAWADRVLRGSHPTRRTRRDSYWPSARCKPDRRHH